MPSQSSLRVIGLVLALQTSAWAQPTFDTTTVTNGALGATSVFAADIDGDGDTDLISSSANDNTIWWYENDGQSPPSLTPRTIATSATGVTSIFAADIDADGDIDVAAALQGSSDIFWYENDGASPPSFTSRFVHFNASEVVKVFLDDIDNDGDVDIMASTLSSSIIFAMLNDGNSPPSFSTSGVPTGGEAFSDLHIVDLDGDGTRDILTCAPDQNELRWYKNNGASPPAWSQRVISTSFYFGGSVFAADVDGDGDMDAIGAAQGGGNIVWYENDGASSPAFTERAVGLPGGQPVSVFAADFDGDGDVDVASAQLTGDSIKVYENDGSENFTTRDVFVSADGATGVFAADIDSDGVTDLISSSRYDNSIRLHRQILTARNVTADTTHPSIADALTQAVTDDSILAASTEFEGEPEIDFAGLGAELRSSSSIEQPEGGVYTLADGVTLGSSPRRVLELGAATAVLAESDDSMRLDGELDVPLGSAAHVQTSSLDVGASGRMSVGFASSLAVRSAVGVEVGGDVDLAAGSSLVVDSDVAFRRATGFESHDIPDFIESPFCVFSADVDGDGDNDIVSASNGDSTIAWYENDGGVPPTFTKHVISNLESGTTFVRAADLDNDSDIDVFCVSPADSAIRWFENDGSQNFTRRTLAVGVNGPSGLDAADIDADGDMDVVSSSYGDSTIRWFQNDGGSPPAFGARTVETTIGGASALFAIDIDGDSDIDIVSAAESDNAILWHQNNGLNPPAFTTYGVSGASAPRSVHAGDIDADGDIDIVSASTFDNSVRWIESDGGVTPNFTPHLITNTATYAFSVRLADLDSDGDLDVLCAAELESSVIWYENDGQSPPSFTERLVSASVPEAVSVDAADLDGDSDLDVVAAGIADVKIAWHENVSGTSSTISAGALLASEGSVFNARNLQIDGGVIAADAGLLNTSRVEGFGTVAADMTNDSDVILTSDTQIIGDYINSGTTTIQSGTLTILGTLTNNGEIIGDFGDESLGDGGLFARDEYNAGPSSSLLFPLGGTFAGGGHVKVAIDDHEQFDLASATVKLTALEPQTFEVMSLDIGPDPAGLDRTIPGHYPLGTLRIGPTATTVNLIDAHDNAGDGQTAHESIYVANLIIDTGATLNTNDCIVYYQTLTQSGSVDNPAHLIRIAPDCQADWTGDAVFNTADFVAYLNDFNAVMNGSPYTFADPDIAPPIGVLNTADFVHYLNLYVTGCP